MIPVDRDAGGAAMRNLLRGGDRAKAWKGRHIVIFPEGTRVDPGELALHPGVVHHGLGLPLQDLLW